MQKPVLIIQLRPEDETADSELAAICRYGGLEPHEFVRLRAERKSLANVDLDAVCAIIVGGSPFDVSTPLPHKGAEQLRVETEFHSLFAEIEARDFPFLGACSGNGLLGSYCGAHISTRFGEPVGSAAVHLTEAGRNDPLLAGLPDTFNVLLGHKEACDDVPPGTVLLARGETCPVQMFRLRENIYATQFHPEADAAEFQTRIRVYRENGYFPAETADALIREVGGFSTPESNEILRRFVRRFAR